MHRFVAQGLSALETRVFHAKSALSRWKHQEETAKKDNSTALDYYRKNRIEAENQFARAEEALQNYKDQEGVTI